MIKVECPDCGTVADLVSARPTATSFCASCDYPMFWALPEDVAVDDERAPSGVLDPTLRRRPGTAGRLTPVSESCRSCGEPNRPDAVYCLRCGVELHPAPVVVEPPPPPPPEPEPEPEPERIPIVVLVAVVVAFVGLLVLAGMVVGAWAVAALIVLVDAVALVVLRRIPARDTGARARVAR